MNNETYNLFVEIIGNNIFKYIDELAYVFDKLIITSNCICIYRGDYIGIISSHTIICAGRSYTLNNWIKKNFTITDEIIIRMQTSLLRVV